MKQLLFLIILISNLPLSTAQDLIRNGGFEDYKSCVLNREQAVEDAAPWFIGSGTPDSYQFNCNNSLYESHINTPYTGDVFLAIGGGPAPGGGFFAESIAIEFTEPLIAGTNYLLRFNVRSYRFNGTDEVPRNQCFTNPRRQLQVYLSQDSFKIEFERNGLDLINSTSNGYLIFADSSESIAPSYKGINNNFFTEELLVPWTTVTLCLTAKGGERFLAFSPTVGKYTTPPNCPAISNNFAGHYFNLDDISFIKFPKQALEVSKTICIEEPNEIRLRTLLPQTIGIEAIFEWADGWKDSIRTLYKAGVQPINIILPCDTIPLLLTLEGEDCKTNIFVPNAFTPHNYDGVNDDIKPFIQSYWDITDYEFQIYNRWGQLIFRTKDYNAVWDGKINGRLAISGVYVWMVKYEQMEETEIKTYHQTGDFLLMR